MCGITGFWIRGGGNSAALKSLGRRMAATISHRGPDSEGAWSDGAAGLALASRRLAILDLTPAGHQPMLSPDGRYVLVFNGEIYNFRELRRELETLGRQFCGGSDTEVIVQSCAEWGVSAAVERFVGMFAFALWDRETRTLTLVRDRVGIKPLYWSQQDQLFLFASELKALRAHSGWRPELDRDALAAFMRHNYVPAPHSIYRGVYKLGPGQILTLGSNWKPEITTYWSMRSVAREAESNRLDMSAGEAVERLDELLREAISCRMVADVPLGALFSGGIDSSTVVALMQAESTRPVKTFSIGFWESEFDEAHHAKAVAAHLGTDHTELYIEPRHALDVIPRLPDMFDEPFADSSQIPTFLVSELARGEVKVALSGDGGDELFAGYARYLVGERLWRYASRIPLSLRKGIAWGVHAMPATAWNRLLARVPRRFRMGLYSGKILSGATLLSQDDPLAFYRGFLTHWDHPDGLVIASKEPHGVLWDHSLRGEIPKFVERSQFADSVTYLPDDILTKVDRASMAVSLETRVPLLDHRVLEFVWRLPTSLRVRDGGGKWILRQVLGRYVPRRLIDRPKMGFAMPIDAWLRAPLRDWAETLLDERRLREDGIFDPVPIREAWSKHLSGEPGWGYRLWVTLMFCAWQEAHGSAIVGTGGQAGSAACVAGSPVR